MSDSTRVSVRVLGREFEVSCPEDQVEALMASADYLNEKIREISGNSSSHATDRVAVLAGLNIAHELLQQKNQSASQDTQQEAGVERMLARVQETLQKIGPGQPDSGKEAGQAREPQGK